MHTHRHTHSLTHTHTHFKHSNAHPQTQTHADAHTHRHKPNCTHTHTNKHTLRGSNTHTYTHTQTRPAVNIVSRVRVLLTVDKLRVLLCCGPGPCAVDAVTTEGPRAATELWCRKGYSSALGAEVHLWVTSPQTKPHRGAGCKHNVGFPRVILHSVQAGSFAISNIIMN